MSNKQYTFSLPPEASQIIDSLPKMAKSDCVTQALLQFKKEQARQKSLDVIALLKPQEWDTDKDAVSLVQEARVKRADQVTNNAANDHE